MKFTKQGVRDLRNLKGKERRNISEMPDTFNTIGGVEEVVEMFRMLEVTQVVKLQPQ